MTWLTAPEAAKHLGTTPAAVHVLAHRRQWPRRRLGRTALYDARAVAAEVIRRAETPTRPDRRVTPRLTSM